MSMIDIDYDDLTADFLDRVPRDNQLLAVSPEVQQIAAVGKDDGYDLSGLLIHHQVGFSHGAHAQTVIDVYNFFAFQLT